MLLVIAGGRLRCLGLERDAGQIEQDCQSDSREEGRLEGAAWVSSGGGADACTPTKEAWNLIFPSRLAPI